LEFRRVLFRSGGQPRPELRYNNFGFNFSGPLYLPRFGEGGKSVWKGKNKAFFFWNEEWRREIRGLVPPLQFKVPTAAERVGDFSGALTDALPHDPLTGLPYPGNRIPANRLSPAG